MEYNKFPKGSEWRKWDLHVHTPASYSSQYPEDWQVFIKELIRAIKKHNISVIATADYFTIDGYVEIMKYYDKKSSLLAIENESVEIYIIPGVELRLNIFNSSNESINYHIVFDPENCGVDFIKENFIEKLKVRFRGADYELRERNLVAIGFSIVEEQPINLIRDYSGISLIEKAKYLKAAYSTITLDQEDIKKANKTIEDIFEASNIKKKPCLKIIAGKGHGSLKTLKWFDDQKQLSRVGLTREDLTNVSDLIFSNDPDDISFYLGKHLKTGPVEIQQRFGHLKPCIWGSDCHSIGTLLHPSNGNTLLYTWIKSDPTFEGLRQVVFEPIDRVTIQEEKPQEKINYLVIESVQFKGGLENNLFPKEPIQINPNMTVVIGGKSSGKSLLLYHIAKTVDPLQVKEKMKIVGEKGYEFEFNIPEFDFEVNWADGTQNFLKNDDANKVRQITYIPQMYVNHLAEENGEGKLKSLIEEILNQNETHKVFISSIKDEIQKINLNISAQINLIYQLTENFHFIAEEIKTIGDKSAISKNIERIRKEIEDLRLKAGFTESENKDYLRLQQRKEFLESKLLKYEAFQYYLSNFIQSLEESRENSISALNNSRSAIEDEIYLDNPFAKKYIETNYSKTLSEINIFWNDLNSKYNKDLLVIVAKINTTKETLVILNNKFNPFLIKITNQNLLKKLSMDLETELQKIKVIEEKEKILKDISENGKKSKQQLLDNYQLLLDFYNKILLKLKTPEITSIDSNLELTSELTFDVQLFSDGFCNLIDGRSNFNSIFGSCFNDKNEYQFGIDHFKNIQVIFEKIRNYEKNVIKFKSGVDPKEASLKLFEDYFIFQYTIKQNNENILQMSPGKRGLVLLQLILHLSNSNHPILIDQPEDNLDNRTIYNELNQFIKDKKIQRQIIIVTHNANLVVSTDSEEVIVANQQGQEQGKENRKFVFEYVSGALEHTFIEPKEAGILYTMGIREHVCDILEGGVDAFKKRELKYGL